MYLGIKEGRVSGRPAKIFGKAKSALIRDLGENSSNFSELLKFWETILEWSKCVEKLFRVTRFKYIERLVRATEAWFSCRQLQLQAKCIFVIDNKRTKF